MIGFMITFGVLTLICIGLCGWGPDSHKAGARATLALVASLGGGAMGAGLNWHISNEGWWVVAQSSVMEQFQEESSLKALEVMNHLKEDRLNPNLQYLLIRVSEVQKLQPGWVKKVEGENEDH